MDTRKALASAKDAATAKLMREWRRAKQDEAEAAARRKEYQTLLEWDLDERGTDSLTIGAHTVTRGDTVTSRFDTKTFKQERPELYAAYMIDGTRHDFTVKAG